MEDVIPSEVEEIEQCFVFPVNEELEDEEGYYDDEFAEEELRALVDDK